MILATLLHLGKWCGWIRWRMAIGESLFEFCYAELV